MTLEVRQELRKELLFSALSYFEDTRKALSAASRMERFVIDGQDAPLAPRAEAPAQHPGRRALEPAQRKRRAGEPSNRTEADDPDETPQERETARNPSIAAQRGNGNARPDRETSTAEAEPFGGEDGDPEGDLEDDLVQASTTTDGVATEEEHAAAHDEDGGPNPQPLEPRKRSAPAKVHSTIEQIVDFLRTCDFSVERLDDGNYRLDGDEVLSPDSLVNRANDQRYFLGKPQFEVELPPAEIL